MFKKFSDFNNYKIILLIFILFIFLISINNNILSTIFRKPIIKKEKLLIICSILFYIIVDMIIYPFVKLKLNKISENNNINNMKLYDILHNIKIKKNMNILNKINEFVPIIFMIFYFLLCIYHQKINLISYFLISISIISLIKFILNLSTILPDSSKKCSLKLLNGACNDLLCSGHYSRVLLVYLLINKFNLLEISYQMIIFFIVISYAFVPIITKNHYSIDILVAIVVTVLVTKYIPNK